MSAIVETPATMTSLEISELVDSSHADVRRSIERLAERGVISLPPLAEVKIQRERRAETVKVYRFSGEQGKRDSIVVVARLSPEFTARLVDRWQELEAQQETAAPVIPKTLPEALRLAADLAEQKALAEAERDHAIATKAQIGGKREATAMATASAATKKARQLEQELGRGTRHATIIAVENATGLSFGNQGFRPLQKWCKAHDVTPPKVPCPRFGKAVSWPADAWLEVYGVDLGELFGAEVSA